MSSVLKQLGKGFIRILEPVKALADDELLRRDLVRTMGYPVSEGSSPPEIDLPPNIFDEIAAFGDKNEDEVGLEEFYDLLEDLIKITDAMEAFIIMLKEEHPEIVLEEMLAMWLNFMLLSGVKADNPWVYTLFESVGFIQEHSIHYGGIYEMFRDGGEYLRSLFEYYSPETEEHGKIFLDKPVHVRNFSNSLIFPVLGLGICGLWLKIPFQHGWEADPESNSPIADGASLTAFTFLLEGDTKDTGGNTVDGELLVSMALAPKVHGGPSLILRFKGSGGLSTKFKNSSLEFLKHLKLDITADAPDIIISLGELKNVPGSTSGGVSLKLAYTPKKKSPPPKDSTGDGEEEKKDKKEKFEFKFKLGKVSGEGKVVVKDLESDYKFRLAAKKNSIIIKGRKDGFLAKILPPDGLKADFDLVAVISKKRGFYVEGGAKIFFTFPIYKDLGPLRLNTLMFGMKGGNQEKQNLFNIEASIGFQVTLGPIVAVIDQIGFEAKVNETEKGGSSIGLKPPNGVGISVDAEVVKGGGYLFFDPDNDRYAGALQLTLFDNYVLTAIGLITTRLPDGSSGFSMLLIISLEFKPAIQIGMGFFWNGIGMIVGFNRGIEVETLRAGIKSNTIDHILFPENVIQNISRIISDLRAIFPPKRDQFVIGLMAKITWGPTPLLTIELGLVIEFKNPVRPYRLQG